MRVWLNGEAKTLADGSTIGELLTQLRLQPVRVAVEVNEDVVPRKSYAQTNLHDGDRVEVVTFVGGG